MHIIVAIALFNIGLGFAIGTHLGRRYRSATGEPYHPSLDDDTTEANDEL